ANGGRAIRLPARSIFTVVGVSLRLDALSRNSNGDDSAVAVGFAKYVGVLAPGISQERYLIEPIRIGSKYALSLSTAQLVGIVMVALLTWMNTRGLKLGKLVQNIFTVTKTAALAALIVLGIIVGLVWHGDIARANFGDFWTVRGSLQDVGQEIGRAHV